MKKIIIAVVPLLLVAVAAGAYFLLGGNDAGPAGSTAESAGSEQAQETPEREDDPLYLALSPAFVVNFEHNGGVRYLQIELQAMSYEQEVLDKVAANMPAVRNKLILLFSSQDYETLNTLEGKETLRRRALEAINELLRLDGEHSVEELFFTGFVVQ
ncbi:MAG: flagellar basal body-associated FliL family protein [Halioglobus sp.]|nr:flagellar basal body-associated FliL family protein [Halioglobus sp.]